MNPAQPVPPQTPRQQPSQLGFQSLTSASQALYTSNPYFQDYQTHQDPNLLSPYSGGRSRATSVSSVGPYASEYPISDLPIMSLKLDREPSSAGFSDDQRYTSNEPSVLMDTEDDDDDEGTPGPGVRNLHGDGQTKMIGGKNFPHKLFNVVNDSGMWSEDGLSFNITNPTEFSRVLTENKTFKQSSFQSFIRQLNMYDFTKVNRAPRAQRGSVECQVFQFRHNKNLFQRGRPDLVKLITRKSTETPGRKDGFPLGLSHDPSSTTSAGELKPQDSQFQASHEHQCSSYQLVLALQHTVASQAAELKKLSERLEEFLSGRFPVAQDYAFGGTGYQRSIESQTTGSSVSIQPHVDTQSVQTPTYNGQVNFGVPTSTNSSSTNYDSNASQTFQHFTSNLGPETFAQQGSSAGQQYHPMGPVPMNSASSSQQGNMSSNSYPPPQPQPLLISGAEPHYSASNLSPAGPSSPQHHLSNQPQHPSQLPLSPRLRPTSPPAQGRPMAGGRSYAAAAVPMAEPPPSSGFNLFNRSGPA